MKVKRKYLSLLVLLPLAVVNGQSGSELEEVVVTAQKRVKSVQDVPNTVSAVSSETLSTFDVVEFDRINMLTAGMNLNRSPGDAINLTMRGPASTGAGQSMEQSVAGYVDGARLWRRESA